MSRGDKFYWQAIKTLFYVGTFLIVATANNNALAQDQMSAREHILRGNQFLSRRAFQQAIDEYQAALKADPNNATAKGNILVSHNNWGMYYALKKDWPHANQEFETCLQIDPNFRDAARNLSLLKRDMAKDNEGAEDKPWDPRADENTGSNASGKSGPEIKAQSKKTESKNSEHHATESPAAVILTPGIKSSTSTETAPAADSNPPIDATQPVDSKPPSSQANPAQTTGPANYGSQYFNTNKNPIFGTLEDQLSSVEMKVYGHKQGDMPVLKRLEKLEIDTSGTISQGTIKERLEHLKQTFGI